MDKLKEKLNKLETNKKYYFCYKNEIDIDNIIFSEMKYPMFRAKFEIEEEEMNELEEWEKAKEYTELLFLLADSRLDKDLLEIYEAVKQKALKDGSNATVNALFSLRNEIRKITGIDINKLEKEEEVKDDGLKLKV